VSTFFTFLGQTIASSALVIAAFVAVRFTGIGERFLNHHLEKKVADLKHSHDRDIEGLRADLAHFQDRGRRANELEFEAATKVWHAFVDAWLKTQQAIVEFMSFPDLNKLTVSDLATFIDSTELSAPQRQQVINADDKNEMYSKILRLRTINLAAAAIYDGRQTLRTNGIFIPAPMAKIFKDAFNKLNEAQVERYLEFQHGRVPGGYVKSMAVLDTSGEGMFSELQSLVRTTIRSNA
jgi:demethoxyubiquinone hydroxylase (CLK1/Coq7/Cat5 family)